MRMVVSTYQAASGAGAAAMEELELRTQVVLEGKQPTCKIFKQQYAFNLFSHNAPVLSNGYNEEEMKLVKETRKIWDTAREFLKGAAGVVVINDRASNYFPTPLDVDLVILCICVK